MHHAFGDGLNALEIGVRVRVPGGLREAVEGVVEQLGDATSIAAPVLRSAHLPAPASPLVIQSSGRRALAVAALDLQQVRRIRASYGGTVNDVLLAVVTGALRRKPVVGLPLRLTGREPDPHEQLLMIRQGMEQNRSTGGSPGPGAIPVLADRLPPSVLRVTAPVAGQGASLLFGLMVTSIPVPSFPFTLDGAALAEDFPIAPLAAGQALVVGLSWEQPAPTWPCTPIGMVCRTCNSSPRLSSPRQMPWAA